MLLSQTYLDLKVLNPNAEVLNKSAAFHMNINVTEALQNVLKTNLEPKGTIKMLVGGAGDIKLTKDGNILLKEMENNGQNGRKIGRDKGSLCKKLDNLMEHPSLPNQIPMSGHAPHELHGDHLKYGDEDVFWNDLNVHGVYGFPLSSFKSNCCSKKSLYFSLDKQRLFLVSYHTYVDKLVDSPLVGSTSSEVVVWTVYILPSPDPIMWEYTGFVVVVVVVAVEVTCPDIPVDLPLMPH
ncbi:T-complex protein 1 subunit zeta [Capsicum chinense]|nr:T-complex protein 1 subunit zeta [Capsicum chinense]